MPGTLNVSTAVTFVVAGAGVPVAKHGNRALSSRTGGADVLTALGVNVDVPLDRLPAHPARGRLRASCSPRATIRRCAMRPARASNSARGRSSTCSARCPTRPACAASSPACSPPNGRGRWRKRSPRLGTEAAWIVHGQGLDELTVPGESQVVALRDGSIGSFAVSPEDAGLTRAPIEAISGGDAALNAAALLALLEGARGPYRDTVLLNAAAALIVAGRAGGLAGGVGAGRPGTAVGCGTRRARAAAARNQSNRAVALSATYRRGGSMANDMPAGTEAGSGSDVLARICARHAGRAGPPQGGDGIDRLRQGIAAQSEPPRGFGQALKHAAAAGGSR